MKFTTSDGTSLFFEKEGTGAPCIYLHGGPGYWSKSFKHFTGKLLSEEVEIIYLDQRGCGRSDIAKNGDYSLHRLLNDLEELRNHLHIEKWYIIGHSFGGLLAIHYAKRFPEHVAGLILSNATLSMKESFIKQIQKGKGLLGEKLEPLLDKNHEELLHIYFATVQQLLEKDIFYQLQFQSVSDKNKMDQVDVELEAKPDFQQYVFSTVDYFQDYRRLTTSIHCPTLVLTGKYDFAVGPDHHESFRFPNATYIQLTSGHHPYVDCTTEFVEAVLHFIKST